MAFVQRRHSLAIAFLSVLGHIEMIRAVELGGSSGLILPSYFSLILGGLEPLYLLQANVDSDQKMTRL